MTDILIYGDTVRSPELRHEIPARRSRPVPVRRARRARHVFVSSLEIARVRELDGIEAHPYEEVGWDELIASGMHREEMYKPLVLNACRALGIESASCRATFPLELADHLRAEGIELTPDRELFSRPPPRQDATPRSPASAAPSARARPPWTPPASCFEPRTRTSRASRSTAKPLTCEWLKRRIGEVFTEHDMLADEFIVAHGAQSAVGHDMGSGQIQAGEPIVIDLWPRDRETACFADMTRTYVVGDPPAAARRVPPARPAGARGGDLRDQARRPGPGALRRHVRALPGARATAQL